jgi:DNA-binding IclR family transcriptional regulator
MDLEIDFETLILATVCVAEDDGNPMTATEIAFLLDVPREQVARPLWQLVSDGALKLDGDVFRLQRSLSAAELAKMERLHERLEQLRPIAEMLPLRLPS